MSMHYRQAGAPLMVLAFGQRVVGIDVHTGQRLWEYEMGSKSEAHRVGVEGNRVFVLGAHHLVCLDYVSGGELWRVAPPAVLCGGGTTLLAHAGAVVVAAVGEAAAFAADDGRPLWHDAFKGYGLGSVALAVPGASAQVDRTRS